MPPLASPTVRPVCCMTTIVTVMEVIKDTLFNMLQCFTLFYSYMLHIYQLYLVCNPSRLVLQYVFIPRDAMRKRALCCLRVSVRPSVCHVRVLYSDG